MSWPRILGALFCMSAVAGPLLVWNRPAGTGAAGSGLRSLGVVERSWGRPGHRAGELDKPRAMAISGSDEIYLVDKTARIQVYDVDGSYQRGWTTPESRFGRPTGMSFSRDGLLMVADTHYNRVLFYRPDGTLVPERTLGGDTGPTAGRLGWVTDVVQDSRGQYYVSEYGDFDRIHKFSVTGEWLLEWGHHGSAPGEFARPQGLAIDSSDRLYVADACNHRIQVYDVSGESPQLLHVWGSPGAGLGELRYPYNLVLDGQGHLYIIEFGNHRVQKWTVDGQPLSSWGTMGRRSGELFNPWAVGLDSRGKLFVVDTYNNRVYRIRM